MNPGRRNVAFLSFLGFLVTLGFGIIAPVLPFYLELLGGSALEMGLLMSSFMVTRALLARYFGRLSDLIGRKRLVVLGAAIYALLGYLFTVPTYWTGLLLVRGLQGVASAMTWPVGEALVVDSTSETRRGRSLAFYIVASNLGFAAGPFVGGGLLWVGQERLGLSGASAFQFPFLFLALFSAIATLLVWLFVQDVLPPQEARPSLRTLLPQRRRRAEAGTAAAEAQPLPPEVRRPVNVLLLNALGNGFSISLIASLPVFYMKDYLGMEATLAGIVLGIALSVGIVVNVPSGVVADRFGRKPLVILGGYISRTSTAFIPLTATAPQIASLLVLRSFAFQVHRPAIRAMQADLFPEAVRGRYMGNVQALFNWGAALGAPLGGFLYDTLRGVPSLPVLALPGIYLPFLVSAILGIVTTTLVLLFVKETIPEPSERRISPAEL